MRVDLCFAIQSPSVIPSDHGYLLYSAVSRMLPEAHQADGYGIHPIRGRQLGGRMLQLTDHSRLVIRVEVKQIVRFLPLAGKVLRVLDRMLRIGVPQVRALVPAPALRSRLVTIKLPGTVGQPADAAAEAFHAAAIRQLQELGISTEAGLCLGKRRTLCIKGKEVVGYEVHMKGLTTEESIKIQEAGLGGRRRFGCGILSPAVEDKATPLRTGK